MTTAKRPGTRLIRLGIGVILISGILIVMAFMSTTTRVDPGTFQTVTAQGSPSALTWIALGVGVLLLAVGFGRRLLATLER